MSRASLGCPILLWLLIGSTATADQAAVEPTLERQDSPPHAISLYAQGGVGALAGAAIIVGIVLNYEARIQYPNLADGSQGLSCRPCSSGDLTHERALYYGGFAFLGLGAALAITDVVLVAIDATHRNSASSRRGVAWGAPSSLRVSF